MIDWSLNLSQIITPFPPSNLWQIFIWDVFLYVVQKNTDVCHKFMFSLTRFFWQESKQEKASKQEVKTHKNFKKTHKYFTNLVFDRLISKPFSNSRPISSFKFVVDFYLSCVFCTTKCTFSLGTHIFYLLPDMTDWKIVHVLWKSK